MASTADRKILNDIKTYLPVDGSAEDDKLTGIITRGKAYLDNIAGEPLDYTVEALPRQLLFDYVRYVRAQAFEVFAANFQSELLELHMEHVPEVEDEDQNTDSV